MSKFQVSTKMNEKNYLIQFDYAGETYSFHNHSHNDFSKEDIGAQLFMAEMIEIYIRDSGLHKEGAKVSNARLFGKGGELITCVKDFSETEDK